MNNINHTNNNQNTLQTPQSSEQKQKRQRRSKHEPEGREFECEICSKKYLSKAALTNHFQQKHNDILRERNIQKKGRGRPRRYIIENQENDQENLKFEKFFEKSNRRLQDNSNRNPEQKYEKAFNDIYKEHSSQMNNPTYTNWKEYPLLKLMVSTSNNNNNTSEDNNNSNANNECCDVVMKRYLDAILTQCNDDYFVFAIKFIILFRECYNSSKGKDSNTANAIDSVDINESNINSNSEISTIRSADKLPELCNAFFSEYLDKKKYVCFAENEDQYELIEIIQHFCYWLFINKYTKSRICLSN